MATSAALLEATAGLPGFVHVCPPDVVDPFDTAEWEIRDTWVKDFKTGKVIFEQKDVECPKHWSQEACNVAASKYFFGLQGTPQRETSIRQLIHRIARTIADWGYESGHFDDEETRERYYRDLVYILLHQFASFNSPVWFNIGLHHVYGVVSGGGSRAYWYDPSLGKSVEVDPMVVPQGSACFILKMKDDIDGIWDLAKDSARLFKFGSGVGTDLSPLRSKYENLSGGGKASGPISFARLIDTTGGTIKSGGRTRRAAIMLTLKDWHPEFMDFIQAKMREEQKAKALIKAGYDPDFNGEAYGTVAFQNANLSVRLTDEFMNAALTGGEWATHWVTDPSQPGPKYSANDCLKEVARGTWYCGDPGVQFETTIQRWHTCPNTEPINSSNPCVTGDTLVATAQGLRRIDTLLDQPFEVLGGDGKLHRVAPAFHTGSKPVYRLRTRSGYEVSLTYDHLVYTLNRGDVPASDLTDGDCVVLLPPCFGRTNLDEKLAEFIGLLVGGGYFLEEERGVAAITPAPEKTLVAGRIREGDVVCGMRHASDDRSRCKTGMAADSRVADQVKRFAVWDDGVACKQFTAEAFSLDRRSMAALLRGLFVAGGTVVRCSEKVQHVALDSASEALLRQVQLMLLAFGIKSKLYRNRNRCMSGRTVAATSDATGGPRKKSTESTYRLRIDRGSQMRFDQEIGFIPGGLKAEYPAQFDRGGSGRGDLLSDPVVSLDYMGVEPVYDLTEPKTRHFVANGIVVHNCSEYMFLDNTACNLASLRLTKFRRPDGTIDVDLYKRVIRIVFRAQEIMVGKVSYPTAQVAERSYKFRSLGIGYADLGALLMLQGLAYDSDEGRALCGVMTAILTGESYLESARMAAKFGPFEGFEVNREPMLNVMRMHRAAVNNIHKSVPDYLRDAAYESWDAAIAEGELHGYRNSQASVLAPTGTISFLMDCATTGVEPELGLVKYKNLAGGGSMKLINPLVDDALVTLGYGKAEREQIVEYVLEKGGVEGCPLLKSEHLPVFDTSFPMPGGKRSIHWKGHIDMMAAAQPFISGAISKTVNLPEETTEEEIYDAIVDGWKKGLKALAMYRDKSKWSQPLSTSADGNNRTSDGKSDVSPPFGSRKKLPKTRAAKTHHFSIAGHDGYITAGMYEDGTLGEVFIKMNKEGSTASGLMDTIGIVTSIGLQYGVPLQLLVDKIQFMDFEPRGFTGNRDIPIAKSIVDYVFRWLGQEFGNKTAAEVKISPESVVVTPSDGFKSERVVTGPPCTNCGSMTQASGRCFYCRSCGSSSGGCG